MRYTYIVFYKTALCDKAGTIGCGIVETIDDGSKIICSVGDLYLFSTVDKLFNALKKYEPKKLFSSIGYHFKESKKIKFNTYQDLIDICPEHLI